MNMILIKYFPHSIHLESVYNKLDYLPFLQFNYQLKYSNGKIIKTNHDFITITIEKQ